MEHIIGVDVLEGVGPVDSRQGVVSVNRAPISCFTDNFLLMRRTRYFKFHPASLNGVGGGIQHHEKDGRGKREAEEGERELAEGRMIDASELPSDVRVALLTTDVSHHLHAAMGAGHDATAAHVRHTQLADPVDPALEDADGSMVVVELVAIQVSVLNEKNVQKVPHHTLRVGGRHWAKFPVLAANMASQGPSECATMPIRQTAYHAQAPCSIPNQAQIYTAEGGGRPREAPLPSPLVVTGELMGYRSRPLLVEVVAPRGDEGAGRGGGKVFRMLKPVEGGPGWSLCFHLHPLVFSCPVRLVHDA